MGSVWPLTGRAGEVARIIGTLVGPGEGAGVMLAGDPGVGKSRLAREVLSTLSGRCEVRWVVASGSARVLPLGAFAEWIREPGSDPMLMVRSVIDALTASPRGRVVVVGVDDAHQLDDLSAFVVHQLVHRRLAKVVVTVRNREPAPDAITALWKDSYLDRVELHPLSRTASDQLLACVLDGPFDPETTRRLWSLTRGNVLFLRHLIEQELGSGRLRVDGGVWSWSGGPLVFATLGELIDAQMGALSEGIGETVDLLAVGEPLDGDVLALMVGWSRIEEAHAKGLVVLDREDDRSAIRLAHPLYGELRRARASGKHVRRLRGRVFQSVAGRPVRDATDLIHRAVLLLESDLAPDAELFTQAAGAAMQLLDSVLAERLAGAARQVDGSYAATVLHAFALYFVGRVSECERILAEAPDSQFTPEQRGDLSLLRAANLFWGLGLTDRVIQVLDDAQARIPAPANSAAFGCRAIIEAAIGSPQQAIDTANAVLASQATDVAAMAAHFALMIAHGYSGRVDEVVDIAKQGYSLAERSLELSPFVVPYAVQHIFALGFAGYQSEAEAVAERWTRQTVDVPVASGVYASLLAGLTHLSAGRIGRAREWLENALKSFVEFEAAKFGLVESRSVLVAALAAAGDASGAESQLKALKDQHNPYGFLESQCAMAPAWVSAAAGEMSEAIEQSRRAAATARVRGHFAQELMCLQAATQFGDQTTGGRLTELCAVIDGPRVAAAAAYATALAAHDPEGLAAASRRFEEIGDMLAAMDAAAQAATGYRRRNQRGAALTARERALRLAERCDGACTPALREALATIRVTARQREILALAEQGLSNRQIAERLHVSVRTVEGHRYRARTK